MVEGAAYSHIHDLLEVVARYPGEPLPRAAADLGGIRTLLVVPLRKDSELLGVITAYRQETRPFSDKQIALLQNFAAQAVIAMENARLLTEQQEALEQQTATAEVLQVINASPGNLTPVFDAMLEKAIRLCEAEFGTLRTWDGERFHLGAAHGDPELIEWTKRQRPFTPINGNFPLGRIVRGAEIVRITDAPSSGFGAIAAAIAFRSGIAVALRKDATLLGAITVYRQMKFNPSQTDRSPYCRTSRLRRSSRWRTRGCWTKFASARKNSASRSRTWATASPCSTKRSIWPHGTASFRISWTCPTPFSNSVAPMRNTSASLQSAASSGRVSIRLSRLKSWSPVPANPTAMSARGRMAE